MTANVVGMVGDEPVAVTSDGRVWALGRSWSPDDAEELTRLISKATGLARGGTESPTDMGKLI